jgi:hypothetical protein
MNKNFTDLLSYNQITGIFTWKTTRNGAVKIGSIAGSLNSDGYMQIKVFNKLYRSHRLAWFMMTGKWPKETIDHIDGDRKNNRFSNLREATKGQNRANSKVNRGRFLKGAYPHSGKWVARITHKSKTKYLGFYETEKEAHLAYQIAAKTFHQQFARMK